MFIARLDCERDNVSLIAKFTVRAFHEGLFWFARSCFFNALCVSAFYTQYTSVLYNEFTIFNKIVEVNFGFLKIQENNCFALLCDKRFSIP